MEAGKRVLGCLWGKLMEPIPYKQFRTGLTYQEVYHLIWGRKWERRHGVLGKWREIKLAMYDRYVAELEAYGASSSAND